MADDITSSNFHSTGPYVDISSSWILECKSKNLEHTVTFNTSNKSASLEDVVQVDTCLRLIQNEELLNNKEPCTIIIKVPQPSTEYISQLVIVSEARIIELFGSCGEYLCTCTAEYIDDFEDCTVYLAECAVKPSRELLIKFQKTKHADTLWLYGINLRLCQNKPTLPSFSNINFQRVNDILKEAKIPISENAEKCKTFLQSCSEAFDHNQYYTKGKTSNRPMLMKMLEAEYFSPLSETGKNMSKCISSFVPFMSNDNLENKSTSKSDVGQYHGKLLSEIESLKSYIDQRFTEIENKVDKIDQKVKEIKIRQNEKLDIIIGLLNRSNC